MGENWSVKKIGDEKPVVDDGIIQVTLPPGMYAISINRNGTFDILQVGFHNQLVLVFDTGPKLFMDHGKFTLTLPTS
jgi:hypothetical protein